MGPGAGSAHPARWDGGGQRQRVVRGCGRATLSLGQAKGERQLFLFVSFSAFPLISPVFRAMLL